MLTIKDTGRDLWKPVNLGEAGEFEVLLRKPTWDQLSQDTERSAGYLEARLKNCVIGWRHIEINGESPEFSWDNFKRLCELAPVVFHVVSAIVSDLYYSFGDTEVKNSEEASSAS